MSGQTITDRCEAGALVRRHLRAILDVQRADWTEHKGLLSSTFVVTTTGEQWRRINADIKTLQRQLDNATTTQPRRNRRMK